MTFAVSENALFALWITFTVCALIGLIAALVWAVRTRQFSNQQDARSLPLKSEICEPKPKKKDDAES